MLIVLLCLAVPSLWNNDLKWDQWYILEPFICRRACWVYALSWAIASWLMAAVLRVWGPTQSRFSAVLGKLCWLSRGTCVSGALKWGCRCARMGGGCWTVEGFSRSQAWSSATCSLDLLDLREIWGHNLATGVEAKWLLEPISPKKKLTSPPGSAKVEASPTPNCSNRIWKTQSQVSHLYGWISSWQLAHSKPY